MNWAINSNQILVDISTRYNMENSFLCADCFEVMKILPDRSIDLILTDPPYSELTHMNSKRKTGSSTGSFENDSKSLLINFDPATPEFWKILLSEFSRIARRWIIMTVDYRHISLLNELCDDKIVPLDFVRFGIWDKLESGTPQLSGDRPAQGWEAIAMLHIPGKKYWNHNHKTSVYRFSGMRAGGIHPTQKPDALITQLMKDFSDIGELVFDPFAGSGVVPYVAKSIGRRYYAVEKDSVYYQRASDRISQSLF